MSTSKTSCVVMGSVVSVLACVCWNRNRHWQPAFLTQGPTAAFASPAGKGEGAKHAADVNSPKSKVLGLAGGLGYAPNYGLVNHLLSFLGAIDYAHEHDFQYMSEDTLKFYAGWDAADGNTVAFGDLFSISHWNARAMGSQSLPLPLIVKDEATQQINASRVFERGRVLSDIPDASKDPSVCWFWGSLRPSDKLKKVVETVRPGGTYGVLHARIENDLRAPGIPSQFWNARTPLPITYGKISNSSDHCLSRPDSFYMCVMASDVTEPEDVSILERRVTPWPNASLMLGGYDAVRRAGLEGSKIQGAVLDFEIAREAKFFIGVEGLSSFTRAIMTSRTCSGVPCNMNPGPRAAAMKEATFR